MIAEQTRGEVILALSNRGWTTAEIGRALRIIADKGTYYDGHVCVMYFKRTDRYAIVADY